MDLIFFLSIVYFKKKKEKVVCAVPRCTGYSHDKSTPLIMGSFRIDIFSVHC